MKTPFRLDQHPRRAQSPLSEPPAGYFDKLPTRVMAHVVDPMWHPYFDGQPARVVSRPASWLSWLTHMPTALRTGLASALVLSTYGVSFWLSTGPSVGPAPPSRAVSSAAPAANLVSLDAVPREQLVAYLLAPDTPLETADLAASAHQLGLNQQFLRPSAHELAEALDGQPTEESTLL